jgi:pimeloyl-ACP methyl ester carboxylesterase
MGFCMMLKICFFCSLFIGIFFEPFLFSCCFVPETEFIEIDVSDFKPDILITEQNSEDLVLLQKMRNLFFEKGECSLNVKNEVYRRAVRDYGGQECVLLTQDNLRISSLYFEREDAPINIIYITGYFHDGTPVKEWTAPFAVLFPNINILSFDWRGFGDSEGRNSKWTTHEFGPDAYRDIQAAVDFFKQKNEKKLILVGFCFGAAMALYATLKAQEEGNKFADALVLDSIFDTFQNMTSNAFLVEERWYRRCFMYPSVIKLFLDNHLQGDIFSLKPIEMVEKISIPCFLTHFTNDPFATISQGIKVFEKIKNNKMFLQSDLGKHVRVHAKVPSQYRDSFYSFLHEFGFLSDQDLTNLKSNDLNFENYGKMKAESFV